METKREEEEGAAAKRQQKLIQLSSPNALVNNNGTTRDCPFLDTVDRKCLDFDFVKKCSLTGRNVDVYACLVCGKYYHGRKEGFSAHTHSIEAGHRVYIHLETERFYCLPDGYEVIDPSLDDIRHVLNPRLTTEQVSQLDANRQWSWALDGSYYLPGMVGLSNIKEAPDFVNVTIQSLMRVTPLRNFFLLPENYQDCKSQLVHRYGELTQKICHARNFKGQVSPHEFLQAVKNRFQIADGIKCGDKSNGSKEEEDGGNGLISDSGQACRDTGPRHQESMPRHRTTASEECLGAVPRHQDLDRGTGELEVVKESYNKPSKMPFLMLGLELPPPPLFQDILPQVPIFNMLKKAIVEVVRPRLAARMRYRVARLPQYLILHMRRFTKNNFVVEKNPTLVNFPLKSLELKDCTPLPERLRSKYDLIANIVQLNVHDGKPGEGSYRAFVQRKSDELWYEMQDLHVSETLPQTVALSEAYIQIYEQQQQ
ncbi:hypothetical protein BUALT_Bualt02G0038800 [Buddleja alternifolia]|uniref:U4/U6.U5 tri-snRNP-associated protein 2 n=1 Tax=Buddleja alternifolia TaxID=168488 RepID=A0AAV6Y581_9LAMI|nr:hypothetical protein BUALT_Bualt02G0038800 [Buddleja alternifolia]